jgi:branched-chain amino acid transport system substrate-binding protein
MQRLLGRLLIVAILCTLVVSGCAQSQPAASSPSADSASTAAPYRIGFLAAVSGGASSLGEPERDSAVMLQEEINAAGGIIGPDGVRHPVEILIYDTQSSADTAITLAKKLIDDEQVVAIIGPTTSTSAMAVIPVVQEAEVPLICMASSSAIVDPVAERFWVFKVAQSNAHTSPWQVRYAQAMGWTKVANVYVDNAYGEDGAQAIRDAAADAGIEIVLEETFGAADTDMSAQIVKIGASEAEGVLVTAIPPAAAIFTKQYRELGATQPLIHNSGVAMMSFIDLAGAANAEGVVFPMGKLVAADALADDDPQKAVIQGFITDFEASAGTAPSTFAAHAWDSLEIVFQVLATLPDGLTVPEQRAQLRDGVESLQGFVGVDGVFNFSATDHVGLSTDDVVLARITDGAWVYFPEEEW